MDDGRKGYVSGADLMTLQAVDAANLSEADLQAQRQCDPNLLSRDLPEIYRSTTGSTIGSLASNIGSIEIDYDW